MATEDNSNSGLISLVVILVGVIIIGAMYFFNPKRDGGDEVTDEIEILFPKGGESFAAGDSIALRWEGGSEPLGIFLIDSSLENQGASVGISDRISIEINTGEYTYKIPKTMKPGIYRFQMGETLSENFEIISE